MHLDVEYHRPKAAGDSTRSPDAKRTLSADMAWLRTHTWQWYLVAALLGVVALVFFHGTAHNVLFVAAGFVFLGAGIRHVGLLVRGNDVARGMVSRGADSGGFASWMADESRRASRGRARDHRAQDPRD